MNRAFTSSSLQKKKKREKKSKDMIAGSAIQSWIRESTGGWRHYLNEPSSLALARKRKRVKKKKKKKETFNVSDLKVCSVIFVVGV